MSAAVTLKFTTKPQHLLRLINKLQHEWLYFQNNSQDIHGVRKVPGTPQPNS